MCGVEDPAPPGRKLSLAGCEHQVQGEEEVVETARQVLGRIQFGGRLVDRWIRRDHRLHVLVQTSSPHPATRWGRDDQLSWLCGGWCCAARAPGARHAA